MKHRRGIRLLAAPEVGKTPVDFHKFIVQSWRAPRYLYLRAFARPARPAIPSNLFAGGIKFLFSLPRYRARSPWISLECQYTREDRIKSFFVSLLENLESRAKLSPCDNIIQALCTFSYSTTYRRFSRNFPYSSTRSIDITRDTPRMSKSTCSLFIYKHFPRFPTGKNQEAYATSLRKYSSSPSRLSLVKFLRN